MHLSNLSCLDQWWHVLLSIVLRAHALVRSRPSLCRHLLQTLHAQFVYSDRYLSDPANPGSGVLDSVPQNKSKLRDALTLYKRRLNESLLGLEDAITPEQAAVGHAFVTLETWFWKYGWDLRCDYVPEKIGLRGEDLGSDQDEDYVPVVVRLDEKGREVGLVSWS